MLSTLGSLALMSYFSLSKTIMHQREDISHMVMSEEEKDAFDTVVAACATDKTVDEVSKYNKTRKIDHITLGCDVNCAREK